MEAVLEKTGEVSLPAVIRQLDQLLESVVKLRQACVPIAANRVLRTKQELQSHRARLFAADNRCHFCETTLDNFGDSTLDHLTPRSRGGDDSDENLALSCFECNHKKGPLTETEFRLAQEGGES